MKLTRWLRRHQHRFDLVSVARLRREACATIWSLQKSTIPVVLRAELDDCFWQGQSALGARCRSRCRKAAAVICRDRMTQKALLDAGYGRELVHRIPDGIPPIASYHGGARLDARLALAAVNQDLNAAVDAPIALFVGRLRPRTGLTCLVRAWERVVRHWPTAKLWLIGDGPYRDHLHQLIRDLDLKHCVLMPGTFESTDELLRAANLLVHAGPLSGVPRILLAAAASGIPILAGTGPEIQKELESEPSFSRMVTLIPRGDVAAWGEGLINALRSSADRETLTSYGRMVLRERPMTQMIQDHLKLFYRLIDERVTR